MGYERALLAIALSFSAAACHSEEKTFMNNATPRPDNQVSALSEEMGVPIPADAQVVGVKREAGIDVLVRVKLLVSPASRERFLATLPIQQEALRPGVGRLGTDDGFWNPHATPLIRSGSKTLKDGHYLLIGIADATAGTVVFLAKHGT